MWSDLVAKTNSLRCDETLVHATREPAIVVALRTTVKIAIFSKVRLDIL